MTRAAFRRPTHLRAGPAAGVDGSHARTCRESVLVSSFPRLLGTLALTVLALASHPGGLAADSSRFDPLAGLPDVQNYLPDAYQAHAQIFATAQSPDGVLYFGTFGNVVSFDGERWRRYPVPGAWIRCLAVGADGLIYVGGAGVLGRLEPAPATGLLQFTSLASHVPAEFAQFATVWSAAREGPTLFFAIDGAVLEWTQGTFRATPFAGQRPALRPAGGALYCHLGDTLLAWNGTTWAARVRDARLGQMRRSTVMADGARGLVIGRDDGRMLRLPAGASSLEEWPAATALLQPLGLRNGVRLDDGRFVLSTGGEGLLILAPDGTPLQRLTAESGLAQTSTYGLTVAADGTLWIETANGLSHLDPRAAWTVFDSRNGRPAGIGGEPLTTPAGTVFQFSDVGAFRLRPSSSGLEQAQMERVPGLPARIANLVPFNGELLTGNEQGLLLLSSPARLVYKTDAQVEDILLLPHDPSLLAIGLIRGVEVVRVSPTFSVQSLGRVPSIDVEVTNIEAEPDGTLWAGSVAGIALRVRRPPDQDWTRAEVTRFDASRGLPAGSVWVRVIRAGSEMLLASRSGVFRLNRETDRLEPHPAFAHHVPTGVNNVPGVSDERGRFWFQIAQPDGTFQLGCLDTRTSPATWKPLPARIIESLGYGGARVVAYQADAGRQRLWLSGTRSTVCYDVDAAEPTTPPPTVLLTEIAQGPHHWASSHATRTFPFSREPLRFQFASPAASNGRTTYETRLVGYQSAWSTAQGTDAVFTNLSGGTFRFEVRARDAAGTVGPLAQYEFHVTPPWHRSWPAYSAYALAALSGMVGFVRWRLGHAERERRRLEALVATRTTELASARDQAEAASRAKSAFLASMSHELRTPLNGVIGYAQVLQGDARLLPDQRERLRIVHQSGEHLLRMINDVLDLAKIEAGKLELRVAPLALGDLLADVIAAHAPSAAARRLAFTLDAAPDLPAWVEGDAQKLRQVLDNLVGNAIKFTARGSVKIRVTALTPSPDSTGAASSPPLIRFCIVDTGAGISPADQARLFQPFEQAHATRANAPGTGLGLAISRALVERMGGTLALDSTAGTGSTFSFSLSLPAAAAAPTSSKSPFDVTGYEGPPRRVLIVDDHPVNRSLLVDLLQPLGFICHAHEAGLPALDALRAGQEPWPDLAILDVRMEGIDGLELTRRLRILAGQRPLRVLLTSASVLTFNPADGHAAGCDDFLPKPFRTADLIAKIGGLLALKWHPLPPADCHPIGDNPPASISVNSEHCHPIGDSVTGIRIPYERRAALDDALALGDIAEVRRLIAEGRARDPAAEMTWRALDEAAAGFQLSRLRQLLENA